MRLNEPVTNHEVEMRDGQLLVSQTDAGGKIVFVNKEFIDISGFTEGELVGAPHNIVRHPHMPKEAFADLWRTLKTGQPWDGLVKNRTKTGDFYWVHANVTPVIENKQITGFISIRTKPSRADVKAADAAYAAIRNGTDKKLTVEDGRAVHKGLIRRLGGVTGSLKGRMALVAAAVAVSFVAIAGLGVKGMNDSNQGIRSLYEDRVMPLLQLGIISDNLREEMQGILAANGALATGKPVAAIDAATAEHQKAMNEQWAAYMATYLTEDESKLAKQVADDFGKLQTDGVAQAAKLVGAGDASGLDTHLAQVLQPEYDKALAGLAALTKLQVNVSREIYDDSLADFELHSTLGIIALIVSAIVLGLAGWGLARSLNIPLRQFAEDFDAISRNDPSHEIKFVPMVEFQRVVARLRAMRAKLAYATEERHVREERATEERATALLNMADTVSRETRGAVEAVSKLTGEMAEKATEMSGSAATVSDRSQTVAAAATEAMANIQTVAAASEELSASISEIATQVNSARKVTGDTVEAATAAQTTITKLSEAVGRISQVTGLISEIASQTNLLALNATIEAARAGESGKGFAVVASEVKSLANQTSRATGDISSQIGEIQTATDSAVTAVKSIVDSIRGVESVSSAIAAAIEEQNATTAEIARNVTQTSVAAQEVAQRIAEVSSESTMTGTRADSVKTLSGDVAKSVDDLETVLMKVVKDSVQNLERRRKPRYSYRKPGKALINGSRHDMITENISEGGAMLRGDAPKVTAGQKLEIQMEGFTDTLPCHVRNRREGVLHVKFDLTEAQILRMHDEFMRAIAGKQPLGEAA